MTVLCPLCSLYVSKFDPEKVVKGNQTFHGKCWRQRAITPAVLNCRVSDGRQTGNRAFQTYRFPTVGMPKGR